jgi:L-amino acid N-acyltransferase YncA
VNLGIRIRDATAADLPAIDAIYAHEVEHGVATFDTEPRSPAESIAWFSLFAERGLPLRVAQDHTGRVIGYASLSPWSPRPAYSITAETSLYVAAERRGEGIGRALLADLIARAEERPLELLLARIESSGAASTHLHLAAGFRPVGTLHGVGRKFGRLLDVDILERPISR